MIRLLIHRNAVLPTGDYVDNGWLTYDLHDFALEAILTKDSAQITGAEIRNCGETLEAQERELAAYAPLSNLTIQQYDTLVRDAMKWRKYSAQQNKSDLGK